MEELESQIAKIQLGNFKHTNNYVYVTAEKAAGSDAELYVVCELPLFNPAAIEPCEQISLAIASTLKRSYRRQATQGSFENAIASINEELGKLASLGQTHWVDRLNCIVCVKNGKGLEIATCGKVAAYLFRNREFTDISCSSPVSHPLKTFDNYAAGKVRLDDILILSTTQLFNYLSMDRMRNILTSNDFLTATQTIIEILKENAGPEVAFGTLLNLQVPPGQATDEEIDLENYVVQQPAGGQSFLVKSWSYVKLIFTAKSAKRTPKADLPKVSFGQNLKNFGNTTKNLAGRTKGLLNLFARGATALHQGFRGLDLGNFRKFSLQKKFFFISAFILLLAVVINVFVAIKFRQNRATQQDISSRLKEAQALLVDAQTSLLYDDRDSLIGYLTDAKAKIPAANKLSDDNQQLFDQVTAQIRDLEQKVGKITEVQATNLGGLGEASRIFNLPDAVATQINGQLVSFDKASGRLEDGILKISGNIFDAAVTGKNQAVVYNGEALLVWDFKAGKTGAAFLQSVPSSNDFGGMSYYPTNSRVYVLDRKNGKIVNYLVSGDSLSQPKVSIQGYDLNEGKDLAIDGSIYVLTNSGVSKYQAGKPMNFKQPFLTAPFSGNGKIYTEKDWKYLYILDAGNKRVIMTDKDGNIIGTFVSKDFTDLKDFAVDESNKTIYLLNGTSLLKFTY